MGYKAFCDRCDKEISENYVSNRAIINLEGWVAEVMISREGHYNQGVLCKPCLTLLLTEGSWGRKQTAVFRSETVAENE